MDYLADFLARGGKVTVAPTGVRTMDEKAIWQATHNAKNIGLDSEQRFHLAQDAANEARLTSRR